MQDVTSLASPIYYATLMALAQQQGLKTIAWAQGIGPLQTPFTRWLTRQVLQKCTAVTVRDRASAQMMANWQISSLLAPDPVWALTAQSLAEFPLIPTPNIAVNLRSHPQLTASRLETFTQALIEFQEATQAFILLVPFQAEQDLAIAQFLAAQLAENTQIIYLEDPRQLKGLFSQVTLMIGMRLHSLIMAAAAGCLCCAISYDPKVTQLMTELDLSGWELAELPTDAHHIAQTWRKLYSQSQPLNQEQIQSLRDQALGHQQTLTEVMIQR
jgi:polysaccharide pyruvyl transferase CsaB